MLKQHFLVFVAAGAIAIAAPFAVAQDSPTNNQSSQPSQERAKGHHGHRDPAQRTQKLTKHQDSSLSQQDRRAKMMDIRKNADAQVRALLDSNQQKKWDEMQAKREQRMQKRHSEAGSDQPAPSPQQ